MRKYPPIILHTLFHNDEKSQQYRKADFSNLFFLTDDVKSKGNEAYRSGNYYLALDYYEHV